MRLGLSYNAWMVDMKDTFCCLSLPISLNPASILVAARSKAWLCDRSLAGIVGSNPAGRMDVDLTCFVFSSRVLCEGPITRSENSECGVCECDLEASTMRRPRTTSAVQP
jgi:hypothetical protein